jgi:hypothetical protein
VNYSHALSSGLIFVVPILAIVSGACGDSGSPAGAGGGGSSGGGGKSSSGGNSSSGVGSSSGGGSSGSSSSAGSSSSGGSSSSSAGSGSSGGSSSSSGSSSSTLAVNLGTAGNYAVLAKSGISSVPTSAITGNLGISPAAASYITGFSLTMDSTNVFSTSPQVTGKVYAADYAAPTSSNLTTAISDMQLAFTDAAGRAPKVTELGAGNIGGMTLAAGVYKWGTGLLIPTSVTLTGNATDVWILQIAQNLTVSSGTSIVLTGGAMSKNVFWQVSGLADLGTTAHFEGVILSQTSVALKTGASINGRLLAQTAVTIDGSAVVQPAL